MVIEFREDMYMESSKLSTPRCDTGESKLCCFSIFDTKISAKLKAVFGKNLACQIRCTDKFDFHITLKG